MEGPLSLRVGYTLTAANGGTRIDVVGEGDDRAAFRRPVELFVVRAVKTQSQADFARLKQVLEG